MQAKLIALALKYGSKILIAIILLLSLYAWDAHRLHEAARKQHDTDMGLLDKRNKAEAAESEAKFRAAEEKSSTNVKGALLAYAKIIEDTSKPSVPLPARVVRVTGVANSKDCGSPSAKLPEGDFGGSGETREYELASGTRESLEQVELKMKRLAKLTLLLSSQIRKTHTVE